MAALNPTLLQSVDREIEICKELTKFRDALLDRLTCTFGWSDGAVKHAARLGIYRAVRRELEERSLDGAIAMLSQDSMHGARHHAQSGPLMSNLVASYVAAARIHAIDLLKGFVDG